MALQPGQMFRQYRVEAKIGQGGMGVVYKGLDLNLQRTAALKILPPAFAEQNAEARERFIREARSAAQLIHQNIVTVFEAGDEAGQFYIAMEFISGPSVSSLMKKKGRLDTKVALKIIRDATSGIDFAHRMNLVHRDIKPDNILLHPNGMAKVADFGLAKSTNQDNTNLTGTGLIVGTPHYMAPEQCEGEETDRRADIYSLGATLYAMILGVPPYQAKSTMAILHKHVYDPVPDPRDMDPDIPEDVAKVMMKAMAKNKEDRYQTAQKFLEAMDKINLGEQTLADEDQHRDPFQDIGSSTLALQQAALEMGVQEFTENTAAIKYSKPGEEQAEVEDEGDTATLLLMALVVAAAAVMLICAFVFRDNFQRIFNGETKPTTTIQQAQAPATTVKVSNTVLPELPDPESQQAYTKELSKPVTNIRHLPGTSVVIITDGEGGLQIWDFQGNDLDVPDTGGKVSASTCSPKGDRIAVAVGKEVILYEGAGQRLLKTLADHTLPVTDMAFNPTGGLLLTGSADGMVHLYRSIISGRYQSLLPEELSKASHPARIVNVQFTNNQRSIFSASADGTLCFWQPHTRALEKTILFPVGKVSQAIVGSNFDHSTLLILSEGKAFFYDLNADKPEMEEMELDGTTATTAAFSWKNQYLAIGTEEGKIHLFGGPKKKLALQQKHGGPILSIGCTGGGVTESEYIISGGANGKVLVEPISGWTGEGK
ncbi:MAG: serine/threonine-protein kinase [Planctomycetota bacterium]|nr:serine/threonine-protein kinase [Planctomycetota bacterium]